MVDFLLAPLNELDSFNNALKHISEKKLPVIIGGPSDSQKVHFAAGIIKQAKQKAVFLTFNEFQARRLYNDFKLFFEDRVFLLPVKELAMQEMMAKSSQSEFARLNVFSRMISGDFDVIIASIDACAAKTISPNVLKANTFELKNGDELEFDTFTQMLVRNGYSRSGLVEGKGQFAIRGDIVDVFSPSLDVAVRIEFFGDEIDAIRTFDVQTQRSLDSLDSVKIIPLTETIYDENDVEDILNKIKVDLNKCLATSNLHSDTKSKIELRVNEHLEKFERAEQFIGIDGYLQYICGAQDGAFEYFSDLLIFVDEPGRVEQRVESLHLEHYEDCKDLVERGKLMPSAVEQYLQGAVIEKYLEKNNIIRMSAMANVKAMQKARATINIVCKQFGGYNGHFNLLANDIIQYRKQKKKIVVLAGSKSRGQRLEQLMHENNALSTYVNAPEKLTAGKAIITKGSLFKGFEYAEIGLVVIAGEEFATSDEKKPAVKHKKAVNNVSKISAFTDLNVGDYVVHDVHGIGKYVGVQQVTVEGVTRDYVKIKYLADGFVYIPTDQMDLIQKYIGSEGRKPKLSKLGGSEWQRMKTRVKESLMILAKELVELYAKRETLQGFAFSEDSVWQRQFEELFPYNETDDQIRAIEEIKSDMQVHRPMERLLCGDVGFGKTEVAMRAVFKAVLDGKQAAYLCPTTVLAQQQFYSFKERMRDFPVEIEVMSRFRTPKQLSTAAKKAETGDVDVLIGTHRLLSNDIKFKDLGLLVVDEEQRFGVKHKEKIKELYPNIDVLTLTATPIPRTLHRSLSGIRDISLLEQPPEERYPVQTYVMEYEESIIVDAIYRELARGGQVFYLSNRVKTINYKAENLRKLMPDVKIGVAHGQMNEHALEDIIQTFISGQIDVLLCTTIIESGIDMPNVNTLIVENAEMMGLSQLYQLRGRVGRSNKLAYAYITYKKDKVLTEEAEKRLQAIKEFTEFGSGFKIAMRDLEIRGSGNLLGKEQHGHLETVGYEMYCKLLDEAVHEIRGDVIEAEQKVETSIDVNVSAYIDSKYIPSEQMRIEMYQKVASINSDDKAIDVRDEFIDRFGEIPQETDCLIEIGRIKYMSNKLGIESVSYRDGKAIFKFANANSINVDKIGLLVSEYGNKLKIDASMKPVLEFNLSNINECEVLPQMIKILLIIS